MGGRRRGGDVVVVVVATILVPCRLSSAAAAAALSPQRGAKVSQERGFGTPPPGTGVAGVAGVVAQGPLPDAQEGPALRDAGPAPHGAQHGRVEAVVQVRQVRGPAVRREDEGQRGAGQGGDGRGEEGGEGRGCASACGTSGVVAVPGVDEV